MAAVKDGGGAPGEGTRFLIGRGVLRQAASPYERKPTDPVYRPLRIYAVDPSMTRSDGGIARVDVPYEKLAAGPSGRLFVVDNLDGVAQCRYRRADLNDPGVLIRDGYEPSQTDPCFHQQMVYAVASLVYQSFRIALGRHLAWGFDGKGGEPARLSLCPHASLEANAYYDKAPDESDGVIRFGYYKADSDSDDRVARPGGFVFTCLSQDVVAHEVSHAILDGLRANFSIPTGPDVLAFHEALADLIALFQHFRHPAVVSAAIRRSHADMGKASFLTELATQMGMTTARKRALRSALDKADAQGRPEPRYSQDLEAHDLGAVLLAAVYEAFIAIYRRKIEPFVRLTTGGPGTRPGRDLPHDLQMLLARTASRLAEHFLNICIRAIDYCPPVGITFGDYLRALITADHDLVPDDLWDYRESLIEAFRRRGIYPRNVANLSEGALWWRPPRRTLEPAAGLSFASLRFDGTPGRAASIAELLRQACALGEFVTRPEHREEFGLLAAGDERLAGDDITLPEVHSVRTARRAGPDRQVLFDLVAEVTQVRRVAPSQGRPGFAYHGGATVILDPQGEVRYAILKSVVGTQRLDRRRDFLEGRLGTRYWEVDGDTYRQKPKLFKLLHE